MKKLLASMLVGATVLSCLTACGSSDTSNNDANKDSKQAAEDTSEKVVANAEEDAATADVGFTENEIFSDEEIDFINLSAVWFQAVPMENETTSYTAEDADIHIEADISALENDLGYGVGDWIPYLTVDYAITDADGNDAASGTFMTMAASDGPHYGANIKLDPGTYSLTITIHSPGENGYLIHSDSETGPGGSLAEHFKDGNFTYTYDGWEFAGLE